MRTDDFDFALPPELVSQAPTSVREHSRLLVLNRSTSQITHRRFADLIEFLQPGDLLVLNDSRVLRARLRGSKNSGGAKIEMLLFMETELNLWWTLLRPGKRVHIGTEIILQDLEGKKTCVSAVVIEKNREGHYCLKFAGTPNIKNQLDQLGEIPLPPYITRRPQLSPLNDYERYQTVFASVPGSVAAPTAGLHFSNEFLSVIAQRGIQIRHITLHAGLGTFAPVKSDLIENHVMHEEQFELGEETVDAIRRTQEARGRIIAVGTTTVRVLETVAQLNNGALKEFRGATKIFIYPPFQFRVVDALITNFHLPKSTLLMLVSAFAAPNATHGREMVLSAYANTIRERYRFFSYGDAMLLL